MLRIKLLPYEKLKRGNPSDLLKDLREGTILVVDAKLDSKEETQLIEETMKLVSDKFSGIEMSSLDLDENSKGFEKLKKMIVEKLTGKRRGITIIGPAKKVRKIKKNPEDLILYM